MEIWSLTHPRLGLIEVEVGVDSEFKQWYVNWPSESMAPDTPVAADATALQRLEAFRSSPFKRLQVKLNGDVHARFDTLESKRIGLEAPGSTVSFAPLYGPVNPSKPHLKLLVSPLKELLQVDFREGSEVIEFDPPAGSRGAARRAAMDESSFKRTMYPLLTGLGKSGWALAVIVLGPLLGRLMDKLLALLPDVDLPQPTKVHLPVPVFDVTFPEIPWPHINFPDLPTPPDWVLFLLEHTKIWVPILLGIAFAITATRNHKKSEETKKKWEQRHPSERGGATPRGDDSCERGSQGLHQ